MKIKINGALAAGAADSLGRLTSTLYHRPGMHIVAIVDLAHVERTQPAEGEEREAVVTLGIKGIEIANDEQEDTLRKAMRALYLHRTARGTLDEESGEVELTEQTLRHTAGLLTAQEAARLRVQLAYWANYMEQATRSQLTTEQMRAEMTKAAQGMRTALGHEIDE